MQVREHLKLFLGCLTFVSAPLFAQALVYEGFNYDLALTDLDGVAVTGTGLSGSWDQRHTANAGEASNVVSGLTFGSLVTSGNAFILADRTNASGDRYNVATAAISASSTANTLWHSHLIQLGVRDEGQTANSANPDGRWQSLVGINASTMTRTTAAEIGFMATRDGSTSQGSIDLGGGASNGGVALSFNQTYLVVGKLTGMHDAGIGVEKTADMWVLDVADFSAVSGAGFTEAALDANNVFQVSRSVTSDTELGLSGLLHLHTIDWTTRNFTPTYDEIRFGETAASVMPIPEPGTLALVGVALGALILFRRRR